MASETNVLLPTCCPDEKATRSEKRTRIQRQHVGNTYPRFRIQERVVAPIEKDLGNTSFEDAYLPTWIFEETSAQVANPRYPQEPRRGQR